MPHHAAAPPTAGANPAELARPPGPYGYKRQRRDGDCAAESPKTAQARELGLKSTGHAGGIHNWRIAGQGLSFEQMLKEMGTGLVVTELMGQGVSAITGDYSRGAAGFWVENGEIQYPVSEITIAGNLKDMWRNIVTVGNDIETRSNIQCGSVLLPEMKIAGQ